jgi:hypothetical protein
LHRQGGLSLVVHVRKRKLNPRLSNGIAGWPAIYEKSAGRGVVAALNKNG